LQGGLGGDLCGVTDVRGTETEMGKAANAVKHIPPAEGARRGDEESAPELQAEPEPTRSIRIAIEFVSTFTINISLKDMQLQMRKNMMTRALLELEDSASTVGI